MLVKTASKHKTIDWGTLPYEEALEKQRTYVDARIQGRQGDILIFTEHPPVYTLGLRKEADKHLLCDAASLAKAGIELVKTNRGGDITYHGPGQIVGYPIISLTEKKDLHAYLRSLEDVLIQTLKHYGLKAKRSPGKTGIWLDTRKIAAMGVAVRKWVTYHGFALNANVDLSPFSGIIPCGISPKEGRITSMQIELGRELDLSELKTILAKEFWKIFKKS